MTLSKLITGKKNGFISWLRPIPLHTGYRITSPGHIAMRQRVPPSNSGVLPARNMTERWIGVDYPNVSFRIFYPKSDSSTPEPSIPSDLFSNRCWESRLKAQTEFQGEVTIFITSAGNYYCGGSKLTQGILYSPSEVHDEDLRGEDPV